MNLDLCTMTTLRLVFKLIRAVLVRWPEDSRVHASLMSILSAIAETEVALEMSSGVRQTFDNQDAATLFVRIAKGEIRRKGAPA